MLTSLENGYEITTWLGVKTINVYKVYNGFPVCVFKTDDAQEAVDWAKAN